MTPSPEHPTREMEPCPWCGGPAILTPTGAWKLCRAGYCRTCEIEGPVKSNEEKAIEAWNTRASLAPTAHRGTSETEAVCETCEGDGGVTNYIDGVSESTEPCPDCQPDAGKP